MNKHHLLIDLETLGTKPGAVVLSIGATRFRFGEPLDLERDTFFVRIDPRDSQEHGLTIDADTMMWWLEQGDAARKAAFFQSSPRDVYDALVEFDTWARPMSYLDGIYGNSPSFDLSLLAALYEAVNTPKHWSYWQERDVRTELALYRRAGIDVDGIHNGIREDYPNLIKHHALDDAIAETELLLRCWAALEGRAA